MDCCEIGQSHHPQNKHGFQPVKTDTHPEIGVHDFGVGISIKTIVHIFDHCHHNQDNLNM
jgi:hypothetical protein